MNEYDKAVKYMVNSSHDTTTFQEINNGVEDWCPTFMPKVDQVMLGGLPLSGRITEIYGDSSVGKTTLALTLAKHLIKMGVFVEYFDVEGTTTREQISSLGINPAHIIVKKPTRDRNNVVHPLTVEKIGKTIIDGSARFNKHFPNDSIVYIWDTVAETQSDAEDETNLDKNGSVASQARALSKFLKKAVVNLDEDNASLVVLNQARADMSSAFVKQTVTTGGHSLKHNLSLKLLMKKGKSLKQGQNTYGHQVHMYFKKSKIGDNANAKVNMDILTRTFGRGYDLSFNIYREARDLGLIHGTSWQTYNTLSKKPIKKHGSAGFIKFLQSKQGKPVFNEMWQRITKFEFPTCYPALFNMHCVLSSKDYPFLKGLRAYYIKKQENIKPGLRNSNYKYWRPAHLKTVKRVMKK